MASKRRLRRNACDGKKAYPTEEDAARAQHAVRGKLGRDHLWYRCHFCGRWHLGGRRRPI